MFVDSKKLKEKYQEYNLSLSTVFQGEQLENQTIWCLANFIIDEYIGKLNNLRKYLEFSQLITDNNGIPIDNRAQEFDMKARLADRIYVLQNSKGFLKKLKKLDDNASNELSPKSILAELKLPYLLALNSCTIEYIQEDSIEKPDFKCLTLEKQKILIEVKSREEFAEGKIENWLKSKLKKSVEQFQEQLKIENDLPLPCITYLDLPSAFVDSSDYSSTSLEGRIIRWLQNGLLDETLSGLCLSWDISQVASIFFERFSPIGYLPNPNAKKPFDLHPYIRNPDWRSGSLPYKFWIDTIQAK